MLKRKIIGSVLTVGLLLGILLSSAHSTLAGALAVTNTPSPAPAPSTTPVAPNATVVIAPLALAGTPDQTNAVRAALTAIKGYKLTIKAAPKAFTSSKDALAYGIANGPALLIIWAEAGVIHFEMPSRRKLEAFNPRLREDTTVSGVSQMPDAMDLPQDVKLPAALVTKYTQLQFFMAVADYPRAVQMGRDINADLLAATDLKPDKLIEELQFEAGYLASAQSDINTALALFDTLGKATGLRPALQALSFSNEGAGLLNLGDFNDAATFIDQAIGVDATLSWALINRASLAFQQGNDQDALTDYDTVIQADPTNIFALNDRGWLQVIAGKAQEALTDLDAALKADPNFIDAYIDRAVLYRGQGAYAEAISDTTAAITLDPKYPTGYAIRGGLYSRLGRYNEALSDFNASLAINPGDANTLDNRGSVYETLGDDDKALADYTRAIEISPQNAFAYFDRGHIYLKRGDFNGAILDESLAIQFDTRHRALVAYYYRAQAYQGLHRWEEAIADYKKYIAASPQGFYIGAAKAYISAITALLTPTPTPTDVPTDTEVPTATSTFTPTFTNTPVPPTFTPTFTNTPIPPTHTATPTLVPSKTHTPVPPTYTATHTDVPTLKPSATATALPPTKTTVPSATEFPTVSAT